MLRIAVVLVSVVACSGSKAEDIPPESAFQTSSVDCIVPAGATIAPGVIQSAESSLSGPDACKWSLEQFLAEHPQSRIATVMPIAEEVKEQPFREPGTQSLLVVHATSGPWRRASELAVESWQCRIDDGSPPGCEAGVRMQLYRTGDIVSWITLTEKLRPDPAIRTARFLLLVRGRR